jgi:branched-chain amino acid transport system permease protein
MVEVFGERPLIEGIVSLGSLVLILTALGSGFVAAQSPRGPGSPRTIGPPLLAAVLAGSLTGAVLALFVVVGGRADLRSVFIHASPVLYGMLTFGRGVAGAWLLPVAGGLLGVVGAIVRLLPTREQRPLVLGLVAVLFMGLFAGLVRVLLVGAGGVAEAVGRFLFGQAGLTVAGAVITLAATSGTSLVWSANGKRVQGSLSRLPAARRRVIRSGLLALGIAFALLLPQFSGAFIAQVVVLVSLYTLSGLGLNIALGFAGLLDLGFVAFFAVGAYTVGLLTSYGPLGLLHLPFWAAVPIAVLVAMLVGAFLGLPVLRIRGDYLAIATLGFGEIVRLLAGSDFLGPWLGGPQGIIGIQKPCLGLLGPFQAVDVPRVCRGLELGGPKEIYYLAVLGALIVAFVATRLRDSRLGRAWMAIREDEDVAEALGVNLIQTKLLAYMLGASFAGLSGAIFAVLVGSIFASSMQLLVSINVVALIIVGGMGSIPGVAVGALALVGLPELFRELAEYRFLFYGATLIIVMRARPEGLWPSTVIRRELRAREEAQLLPEAVEVAAGD